MAKHRAGLLCSWRLGLVVILLSGCGYQFQVGGPGPTIGEEPEAVPPAEAPRMAIPIFDNTTFQPNLELKYTNYARDEFAAGGGVRVVSGSDPADLVLKGKVVSVSIPSLSFTQTTTLESRVTVTVYASVEDVRTGNVIWTEDATASSEFFVTNDLQFNRALQDRALEQSGRYIAEDLASRFLHHLDLSRQPTAGTRE